MVSDHNYNKKLASIKELRVNIDKLNPKFNSSKDN